jgi:hypothetical protein
VRARLRENTILFNALLITIRFVTPRSQPHLNSRRDLLNIDLLLMMLIISLFVWAQARTLFATTLSDDAALFYLFQIAIDRGELFSEAFVKFTAPLAQGGTVWRPFAWFTFALDAALWRLNVPMWRLTNLTLYVAIGVAIAALVRRLGLCIRVAYVAAGLWLLMPWSAETTVWIVGRFDLLATLGLVVTLWAMLGSRGWDRCTLIALSAFGLSLMSKESAMSFPPFIALALWMRPQMITQRWATRLRSTARDLVPFLLVLAIYLLWRRHLFGGNVLGIYDQTSSLLAQNPTQWIVSGLTHFSFVTLLFDAPRWYVFVALLCATVSIAWVSFLAVGQRAIARAVALALAIVSVSMIAIGFHFREPLIAGDGLRLYMLPGVGLVLFCAIIAGQRYGVALSAMLLVSSAVMQREVNARWWRASDSAVALSTQMRTMAANTADADYVLVIVPDRIGIVPFVRSAQGAMLLPPMQPTSLVTHVLFATNLQLTEWHKILEDEIVPKITEREGAPARPTQYACFDIHLNQVISLGFWPRSASIEAWLAEWRERTRVACPEISKTIA